MEQRENTRDIIVGMLKEITQNGEASHVLLKSVLDKYDYLNENDKAFIKRVTDGTLENQIKIDYVINSFSKVPVNKMKPYIRSLMRMSVYQILYMDRVPDSAAINEAVKLAGKHKFVNLKGFVNGVLRSISRGKEHISYPDETKDFCQFLSVYYSMPQYLVDLLIKQYGKDQVKDILKGMLAERKVSVRLKESLTEKEKAAVLCEWEEKGITYEQQAWLSYAYLLSGTERLDALDGFTNGYYTVQDISSMFVAEIADIKDKDVIIDTCAAPGGKTLHAAEKLKVAYQVAKDKTDEQGIVDSRDVTEYKLAFIEENVERMQYDNITIKVWDATVMDDEVGEKADVLFTDVPCSGLGVIGKKPDIKYRLKPEDFESLHKLQMQIVNTAWQYVKPGGTWIYSTCTIREEENEAMVEWIIKNLPFETESIDSYLPEELHSEMTAKGQLLLLPTEKNDGFFMARFRRV